MKILWRGFLGKSHSWSEVGQNICRALIKLGHQVEMFSTNSDLYFPNDLKNNLIGFCEEKNPQNIIGRMPDKNYDIQLSYTALRNFASYFSQGSKNRLGIWCYEYSGKNALPDGFAKNYKYCDFLLPPSQMAKNIFLDSGIPENYIKVVPHGIDIELYKNASAFDYKLDKDIFKIGSVIGQPHLRKHLGGLLDAYGQAFTSKDNVCLILKIVDKKPEQPFDVSFKELFNNFKNKYKNHALVKVITEFVPDIEKLYMACDAIFTMSHCECFWLPGLIGKIINKIIIAPRDGGQLDYLNDNNSVLIDGKMVNAPPRALYWQHKYGTQWFEPSISDAVEKLRYCYKNYNSLKEKLSQDNDNLIKEYSWDNVVINKLLPLVK